MSPLEYWEWWFKATTYAAFASVGGTLGHLLRISQRDGTVVLWKTLLEGFSAGFVGLLVFFVCQANNLNEQWTGVIVGVCGWLGASATIAMLERLVRKRLGIEEDKGNGTS